MQERDWDGMYLGRDAVWSGEPNPQLVAEVADLPPGRALDLGCGEGADALWLAARGWKVTGVDAGLVGDLRDCVYTTALGPHLFVHPAPG